MIVSDTQMLAYLTLPSPNSELADAVHRRDPEWSAPYLWRSEFRSVLLGEMRVRRLALGAANEAFAIAAATLIGGEYHVETADVLVLAQGNRITAYDLEFVVLARMLHVPLVTFDKKVLAAFPGETVHPEDFVRRASG